MFKFLNVESLVNFSKEAKKITAVPLAEQMGEWVGEFNNLQKESGNTSKAFDKLFTKIDAETKNSQISTSLKSLQREGKGATVTMDGMYSALIGQTKGFGNVKRIIGEYNQVVEQGEGNQANFANIVGESNLSFGNYLKSLNGAKGSIMGYAGQLVKATAATVGLNIATAALSAGVSFLISKAIEWLVSFANREKEAAERAKESAEATNEQCKSLQNLREEYEQIVDSTDSYAKKNEELSKWKDTLVEKYELEKDSLKNVNLERQTGIDLIDKEIKKTRDLWLGSNATAVKNAEANIETNKFAEFSIQNASVEMKPLSENIRKEILSGFDSASQGWDLGNAFLNYDEQISLSFNTNNIYETLDKIDDVIAQMGDIGYDNLTYQEKQLLSMLNGHKTKLEEIKSLYGSIYTTFNQYTAENLFYDYVKSPDNAISKVTEDSFETWKSELLALAGDSKPVKDALNDLIDETFPQFKASVSDTSNGITPARTTITDLKKSLTSLKETFDTTLSNQSVFQSALDDIQKGTSLTSDEVLKLIGIYPELSDAFTKTADGWTISTDKIISANEDIVNRTKASIRAQIDELQGFIDMRDVILSYDTLIMPQSEKDELLENYSPEDYDYAKIKIRELTLELEMLGLQSNDTSDRIAEFNKSIEDTNNKTKLLNTAIDDMNDSGHISASTYAEITENGGNFAECLEIQNGQLILNIEKYKELEIQERKNAIAANELAIAESKLHINSAGDYARMQAISKALEMQNEIYRQEIADIEGAIGNNDDKEDKTDFTKKAFDEAMKETEHLHNMGLIEDEKYYDELEKNNEIHFKNCLEHEADYLSNVEKIYSGRQAIYKQNADKELDILEEQFQKGLLTAREYRAELGKLNEKSYGIGTIYHGTEFATENYNSIGDKISGTDNSVYEEDLKKLKDANSGSIEDEKEFIQKWTELNSRMFESSDPKQYAKNLEEITKYQDDFLKERVDNEISYWEGQKKSEVDAIQDKIDAINAESDAIDKRNQKEQKQLDILKAEAELEKAKINRSRLVFKNGGMSYEVDEEAIQSAQKSVADAKNDYSDIVQEEQIDVLEDLKENTSEKFDEIIDILKDYADDSKTPTESDTEILRNAIEEYRKNDGTADYLNTKTTDVFKLYNITPEQLEHCFGTKIAQTAITSPMIQKQVENIDVMQKAFDTKDVKANPPIVNYNIGDINVTVQGGTSQEMLEQFASQAVSALTNRITQLMYKK